MRTLLPFLKPYRKECVLAPLFKLLEAVLELFVPLIMAAIIDNGIQARDTGYVLRMGLGLVGLGLLGFVSSVTAQFFAAKAAVGFAAKLKSALFRPHPGAVLHRAGYAGHAHADQPHDHRHESGTDGCEHDAAPASALALCGDRPRW